jgi:hypothetical protein
VAARISRYRRTEAPTQPRHAEIALKADQCRIVNYISGACLLFTLVVLLLLSARFDKQIILCRHCMPMSDVMLIPFRDMNANLIALTHGSRLKQPCEYRTNAVQIMHRFYDEEIHL